MNVTYEEVLSILWDIPSDDVIVSVGHDKDLQALRQITGRKTRMLTYLEAVKARKAAEQAYAESRYRARYGVGVPDDFAYADLLEATVACVVAKAALEDSKCATVCHNETLTGVYGHM